MENKTDRYRVDITCPHCNHRIGWHLQKSNGVCRYRGWLEQAEAEAECCVCGRKFPVRCVQEYFRSKLAADWERTGTLAKDIGGPTLDNLGDYLEGEGGEG